MDYDEVTLNPLMAEIEAEATAVDTDAEKKTRRYWTQKEEERFYEIWGRENWRLTRYGKNTVFFAKWSDEMNERWGIDVKPEEVQAKVNQTKARYRQIAKSMESEKTNVSKWKKFEIIGKILRNEHRPKDAEPIPMGALEKSSEYSSVMVGAAKVAPATDGTTVSGQASKQQDTNHSQNTNATEALSVNNATEHDSLNTGSLFNSNDSRPASQYSTELFSDPIEDIKQEYKEEYTDEYQYNGQSGLYSQSQAEPQLTQLQTPQQQQYQQQQYQAQGQNHTSTVHPNHQLQQHIQQLQQQNQHLQQNQQQQNQQQHIQHTQQQQQQNQQQDRHQQHQQQQQHHHQQQQQQQQHQHQHQQQHHQQQQHQQHQHHHQQQTQPQQHQQNQTQQHQQNQPQQHQQNHQLQNYEQALNAFTIPTPNPRSLLATNHNQYQNATTTTPPTKPQTHASTSNQYTTNNYAATATSSATEATPQATVSNSKSSMQPPRVSAVTTNSQSTRKRRAPSVAAAAAAAANAAANDSLESMYLEEVRKKNAILDEQKEISRKRLQLEERKVALMEQFFPKCLELQEKILQKLNSA